MRLVRTAAALATGVALLLGAAPLVAGICAASGACPCPMMSAPAGGAGGPVLTFEMSCCRAAATAASAPSPAVPAPSALAVASPASGEVARCLGEPPAAASASALARAEVRAALGLFALNDVFRI